MERYLNIAKVYLKFQFFPHITVAILLCVVSPFIMGIENLDYISCAKILEMYVSLLGIILLVPIFYPDQDKEIKDLILSKKESISTLHVIRLIQAILILGLLVYLYLVYLKIGNCQFPFAKYYYGTLSTCIFMGGIGILSYSIIDNISIAYAIPILYYMLCYGSGDKYLGKFYLFSMMTGTVEDKIYLMSAGIIMIAAGLFIRRKSSTKVKLKFKVRNV
jgi:hypothetical protein